MQICIAAKISRDPRAFLLDTFVWYVKRSKETCFVFVLLSANKTSCLSLPLSFSLFFFVSFDLVKCWQSSSLCVLCSFIPQKLMSVSAFIYFLPPLARYLDNLETGSHLFWPNGTQQTKSLKKKKTAKKRARLWATLYILLTECCSLEFTFFCLISTLESKRVKKWCISKWFGWKITRITFWFDF